VQGGWRARDIAWILFCEKIKIKNKKNKKNFLKKSSSETITAGHTVVQGRFKRT
jgi:hypothetical protein